jgi:hypothetical protein
MIEVHIGVDTGDSPHARGSVSSQAMTAVDQSCHAGLEAVRCLHHCILCGDGDVQARWLRVWNACQPQVLYGTATSRHTIAVFYKHRCVQQMRLRRRVLWGPGTSRRHQYAMPVFGIVCPCLQCYATGTGSHRRLCHSVVTQVCSPVKAKVSVTEATCWMSNKVSYMRDKRFMFLKFVVRDSGLDDGILRVNIFMRNSAVQFIARHR